MKVATANKQCYSPPGRKFQIGISGSRRSLHQPRRRMVGVAAPVPFKPRLAAPIRFAGHTPAAAAVTSDRAPGTREARPVPRVLHVDADGASATVLASLLEPEARVTHVATLAEARRLLQTEIFSLVVLDPALPDGDGVTLLPAVHRTPLLVYSARHPEWRTVAGAFLPKPWTSTRQLWSTISSLLGIIPVTCLGD